MENEIWKPVLGYEGYMVSNAGRLKSIPRKNCLKERIIGGGKNKAGYIVVSLHKDKKSHFHYLHRLVWEAFNGPIPEGYEVNHMNEDKSDNRIENLNLLTHKENINWGTSQKRRQKKFQRETKHIFQYDLDNNFIKEWKSGYQVNKLLGFDKANIYRASRKNRSAYGYIWSFKKV